MSGCSFHCATDYNACSQAQLFCGDYEDSGEPCVADCTAPGDNCKDAKLFCGHDHDCTLKTTSGKNMEVTCPGRKSLDAPVQQLACKVECDTGQYACMALQVFSPDPTVPLSVSVINSGGQYSLQDANIQCPSSNTCEVDLGETLSQQYAGEQLKVDGGYNAEVTVRAGQGSSSMSNAEIECSDFAQCVIRCNPGLQYACSNLKVNQNKDLLLGRQYGSLKIAHTAGVGGAKNGQLFLKDAKILFKIKFRKLNLFRFLFH